MTPIPARVLFRTDKTGEIIAIFDNSIEYPMLMGYVHVGQHVTVSHEWLATTRPATPDEHTPLLAELARIGYDVTVGKRLSRYRMAA